MFDASAVAPRGRLGLRSHIRPSGVPIKSRQTTTYNPMTIHIKKNGQQHRLLTIDKVNVRPKTRSTKSKELPPDRRPEDVWNSVLRAALALPGVKVDREAFLRRALSKHVSEKVLQSAIDTSPAKAGVSKKIILRIATANIKWHRAGVSSVSFVSGLPGGWWIAGTVP